MEGTSSTELPTEFPRAEASSVTTWTFLTVAAIAIGVLSICTGVSKIVAVTAHQPMFGAELSPISARPLLGGAIAVTELIIGFGLLTSRWRPYSAVFGAGLFTAFSIGSASFVRDGWENCGCFGVVKSSPMMSVVVSIAAAMMLLPGCVSALQQQWRHGQKRAFLLLLASGLPVALSSIVAAQGIGSLDALNPFRSILARVAGDVVVPSDVVTIAGEVASSSVVKVEIRNVSGSPVRIVGFLKNCDFDTTTRLPIEIDARSSAVLELVPSALLLESRSPRLSLLFLYTNSSEQPIVRVVVQVSPTKGPP